MGRWFRKFFDQTVFGANGLIREDLVVAELRNLCNRPYSKFGDIYSILTLGVCLHRGWVTREVQNNTLIYIPTDKGRRAAKTLVPLARG